MRSKIIALFILGVLSACTVQDKGDDDDDDDGGSGGRGGSSGAGGAGGGATGGSGGTGGGGTGGSAGSGGGAMPGAPGWTVMPLIDDERDPANVIFRAGNDMVTGIFFASLDEGFVATSGANQTSSKGGALFRAKQKQVTDIAIGGVGLAKCLSIGEIDFIGVEKTSKGYTARTHACDLVSSEDGGGTFDVKAVGAGNPFGIERVLAYRETATGAMVVRDTGVVSVTTGAPGPNAVWDDIWAPTGVPPTPDPVPADQCQAGPHSQFNPKISEAVYVSPDGKFIAYGASPNDDPQICVSTDGGKSFFPKLLPGVSEDVLFAAPTGVKFATPQVGIAWYANNIYPDATYIYRTTDGGNTWAKVEVPADIAGKDLELNGGFFAPDGQHGWIVGYNYDNSIALVLKTSDGGATWSTASGDLAAKVQGASGGKLRTGFALDAYHLWVGGERGVVLANEAGGE